MVKFAPIHYLRVASHFWPWERAFYLALMHDSVEDGWMTLDIMKRVFGARFADDIRALTRPKIKHEYAAYIEGIRLSKGSRDNESDAIRVKRADLAENYARAPASLRKRYAKAMEVLR